MKRYKPKYGIRISLKNFGFVNNIKVVPLYAVFCIKQYRIKLLKRFASEMIDELINTANNKWLEMPIEDVTDSILNYFEGLPTITI